MLLTGMERQPTVDVRKPASATSPQALTNNLLVSVRNAACAFKWFRCSQAQCEEKPHTHHLP